MGRWGVTLGINMGRWYRKGRNLEKGEFGKHNDGETMSKWGVGVRLSKRRKVWELTDGEY